ncbi:MAG: ABC transporter substrate-binding protein [Anaerolineae bacterium]|nr:ABC transporter substrate-binding protein [Anaerolineae bacterium]
MIALSKRLALVLAVAIVVSLLGGTIRTSAQKVTEINFYYPTAVGGPLEKVFADFAADFNKANPDIKVNTVFAGGYADIYKAVQTQVGGGGKGPDAAIFLSTDLYSLVDNDYIVPLDDFIAKSKEPKMLDDFFPAFLLNSQDYGKTWGIPFQRSTPVLYYNKDMFKAAGLDPNAPPKNWQEMRDFAKKLTKADGSVWGLEIPSDGFPYWLFQGFAIGNGQNLVGDKPNQVIFNKPEIVEALQYFVDLANKDNVMPKGIIVWGNTPTDFTSGKAAMIYHTTGSLTNILKNAKFEVGVGFLPAGKKGYGAPTGGGNIYILKSSPPENQAAAWRWIEYLTSAQTQANWTVATGYIAARKSAWETQTLKDLVAKNPQYAVARDQLQYAAKELTSHQGGDIQKIFGKAVQAALTGEKTPQAALDEAQQTADKMLADYKD